MTTPITSQADLLIAERERLTNRRDEQIDFAAVDAIDTQLAQIPAGIDNRVDLRLGRPGAVLPERTEYELTPRDKLAEAERRDFDDDYILEHWPFCAAACQIRAERIKANEKWSSDSDRAEWKDAGAAQIEQAAQAKQDEHDAYLESIMDQFGDWLDFERIRGDLAI